MIEVTTEPLESEFRYERKFLVSDSNLNRHEMEKVIKFHPSYFYKLYPDRFVNNVYFDTPTYKDFHDNVAGLSHRNKFRIRWYGDFFGYILNPTLEIKIKKFCLTLKKHYR